MHRLALRTRSIICKDLPVRGVVGARPWERRRES